MFSDLVDFNFVHHQVVANCLSALQEIWGTEASTSEEASREREALLSKPLVYYLLNRYVLASALVINLLGLKSRSSL